MLFVGTAFCGAAKVARGTSRIGHTPVAAPVGSTGEVSQGIQIKNDTGVATKAPAFDEDPRSKGGSTKPPQPEEAQANALRERLATLLSES